MTTDMCSKGLVGKRHGPLRIEWVLKQFNLVGKENSDAIKQEKLCDIPVYVYISCIKRFDVF